MPSTLPVEPVSLSPEVTKPASFAQKWLPLALFSILWIDLIRLLSGPWDAREQYAYGWFVPFFAAALLFRRWQDRPAGPQDHRTTGPQDRSPWSVVRSPSSVVRSPWSVVRSPWSVVRGPLLPWSLGLLVLFSALLLLPFRVIYEISRDWPLISWLYTLDVVALTLFAFYLAGGRRWVKHFAFPVCFILIAVVWPYRIEKGLTQGLMQIVTAITVESLGWLNVPALQRGNIIELGVGTVGVDEACSGIRSFQSSLMAALLMGELYRLRIGWRALLVVAGIGLGFCFNVARTLLLSLQVNSHGVEILDKWHDPAGITITIACFFGLWAIAVLITRKTTAHFPSQISNLKSQISHFPSPNSYLLAVGCWTICALLATEAWYRYHERQASGDFHWTVQFPTDNPTYTPIELSERALKMLHHDAGGSSSWQTDGQVNWTAHFFRWNPTSVRQIISARIHRPEVCLPGSGMPLIENAGTKWLEVHGLRLPFRAYVYGAGSTPLYVFFCQWEDGSEK
jgi:exosortase